MKQFLLGVSFLFCADALARGVVPYHYEAYHPDDGAISISIGVNPAAIYVGHAGRGAKFCSKNDEFYCLESIVFDFSVPKSGLKEGVSWERNGAYYEVVGNETITIFGCSMNVYVIKQTVQQKSAALFFYSQKKGLVGFSLPTEDSYSPIYFLRGEKGFPVMNR